MFVASELQFPNNAVSLLVSRFKLIDADFAEAVFPRPLNATDPIQSIGVAAALWNPEQESLEMRGTGNMEPTLNRYLITVQGFVKDMDEERGLNVHSVMSRTLRNMLYNDVPLRQALASLSATLGGKTESARRWGVRQQRFFANEIDATWLYLSIMEFWLETETT